MANAEHLAILANGVEAWNEWRASEAETAPDLSSAELTGQDLSNVDFRNATLSNAVLQEVKFTGATLAGAALNHVLLENCDMNGSDLADVRLTTSAILYSSFEGVSMPRAGFMWAHVVGSNFSRAVLEDATLTYAVLNRVNFRGTSLRRADLTLVSFLDSDLAEADFSGSRLGWTTFDSLTLGSARGLDSVQHRGPSTLGHQVYLRRHKLPDSFLRGIGLPESAIESTIQLKPQEFHSCFISYSTKDQDFADTLHTNLQQNRVRCWLATEDLKIGEQFRNRIDESIMSHDKLLLVLSRDSVESPWVGSEVETAFEKEHRTGDPVLFPIRLDDAVMESKQAWAAEIRRTRHIGDFRSWHDPELYRKALDRVLRDLKVQYRGVA